MVAAQLHAGVNVFGRGQAFGQHKEGLVDHGHQNAVDHKARRVFDGDGGFAQGGGQRVHRGMGGVAGLQAANDFDQRHQGHGVEKVHANEAVGALRDGGQLRDADGAGVGGHERGGGQHAVELAQDVDFEFEVFGSGFDHELRGREAVVAGGDLDAAQRGGFVGLGDFFFFDEAVEAGGDGGQAFVDGGLADVDHDDLNAAGGAGLGNAVAHGASANDADGGDA